MKERSETHEIIRILEERLLLPHACSANETSELLADEFIEFGSSGLHPLFPRLLF